MGGCQIPFGFQCLVPAKPLVVQGIHVFPEPSSTHGVYLEFDQAMNQDINLEGFEWILNVIGVGSMPGVSHGWIDSTHLHLRFAEIGESPTHEYTLDYTAESLRVESAIHEQLDAFVGFVLIED